MRSSSGVYVPALDHLRAFAALMVFMWHFVHPPYGPIDEKFVPGTAALSLLEEGYTGVSLFMVISGFIFSMLFDHKKVSISAFFLNRFLRIFPLLLFWSIFATFVLDRRSEEVALSIFTLLDRKGPEGSWTLIIELQFYLLFPFFYRQVMELGQGTSHQLAIQLSGIAAFILLAFVLRCITYVTQGTAQPIAYWTIFGRIDQFLLGFAAFLVYKTYAMKLNKIVSAIAFAAVVTAFVLFWHRFNELGGYLNYPKYPSPKSAWLILPTIEGLAYASIICLYIRMLDGPLGLLGKAFAFLGTISYSLYLNHFAVLVALQKLHAKTTFGAWSSFEEHLLWALAVGFPLLILLSCLTYFCIERPFLSIRRNYTR